jgi:hypothetical protein
VISGLAYISAEGSLLAPTTHIRFGCGHSSTRAGSRTVIERRSAGVSCRVRRMAQGRVFPPWPYTVQRTPNMLL